MNHDLRVPYVTLSSVFAKLFGYVNPVLLPSQ